MNEIKQTPLGVKLGFLAGFFIVWLGLGFFLQTIWEGYKEGGWGMWPILGCALMVIFFTVERVRYLFFKVRGNPGQLMADVQKHVMHGDLQSAISSCQHSKQPMGNIVAAGLSAIDQSDEDVQETVDEVALAELPQIEVRTGYLAMLGNIATLLGLLGTIIGLITSFAGVSLENENDPSVQQRAKQYQHLVTTCHGLTDGKALVSCIKQNKATILAKGISEAMNCTAFGLLVGIVSLLAFSVLNGRTQHLLDDINKGVVALMNLAVRHRKILRKNAA